MKEGKHMHKKRIAMSLMSLLLVGGICNVGAIISHAEEMPGYHEYVNTEDEAIDTWYGIARGTYLKSGDSSITKKDSTHALCTGNTLAHIKADKVYVRIYLDKSDTAAYGSWGTVNYWTGTETNASMAHVSSGSYTVTKNKYYRVTGAHSVTENGTTEATNTSTNAKLFN